MSTAHRAKIFAPFDALRGFDFCIMSKEVQYTQRRELSDAEKEQLDHQLRVLRSLTYNGRAVRENHPAASVTYFEPCTDPENFAYGKGGQYKTITGICWNVDAEMTKTILIDGTRIPLEDIREIESPGELFKREWEEP